MAYSIPDDFDSFWAETRGEAAEVSVGFDRRHTSFQPLDTHTVELLEFHGKETSLQGWIATPKAVSGPLPGFLWIPAYGRESHLPNEFSTREGLVSMSFNFHGHAAFHKEVYKPERGYFAEGVADPKTWIFRRMAQDSLIAMGVFASQPEVDANRLAVAGLSQGGGMAIWVGANSDMPRKVVADMPFLSNMGETLTQEVYRYPLKELFDYAETLEGGMATILRTVSYFDTAHQATRLTKPTLVSLGLKDPAVRPDSVRKVFESVATEEKQLIEYEIGHDWHVDMITANREFLLQ